MSTLDDRERRQALVRLGPVPVGEVWAGLGEPPGLGEPHWVRRLPSAPGCRLWLAEFGGKPGTPGKPRIVKHIVGGSQPESRYHREVTALRLAGAARIPVVPQLFAAHDQARVLVLERLAHLPPGAGWALPWASGLARLHAVRVGPDLLPPWRGPTKADVRAFLGLAARIGVRVPAGAAAELKQVVARLDVVAGSDLLHGAPGPGSDLHVAGGVRFVGLGRASRGPGLVELAQLRMGLPTSPTAIALSEPEVRAAEAAYRQVYRAETGVEPTGDLADACVGWLVSAPLFDPASRGRPGRPLDLPTAVLRHDQRWGNATAGQRLLHRLAMVAQQSRVRADLGDVGWLCAAMYVRIRDRRPDLASLPASRPD